MGTQEPIKTGLFSHLLVLAMGGLAGWHVHGVILVPHCGFSPAHGWLWWELFAAGAWLFWNLYSALLAYVTSDDFSRLRRHDAWTYTPFILLLLYPSLRFMAEMFIAGQFAVIWFLAAIGVVVLVKALYAVAVVFGARWSAAVFLALLVGLTVSLARVETTSFYDAFNIRVLLGAQLGACALLGIFICMAGFKKRGLKRILAGVCLFLVGILGWWRSTAPPPGPTLPSVENIMAMRPAGSLGLFANSPGAIKVRMEVDREQRDALHFVTPDQVTDTLFLPLNTRGLKFGIAAPYFAAGLSDGGVTFSVLVGDRLDPVWSHKLDPVRRPGDRDWYDVEVDLSPWAGSTVELTIKTDGAPHGSVSAPRLALSNKPEAGHSCPACPPNVVVLLIDTLRGDREGYMGYKRDTTPHLDDLARQGAVFERVMSTAPWTEPATVSLLTGMLPGQTDAGYFLQLVITGASRTLGQYLADEGYMTAAFSGNPVINSVMRFDQGFELFSERCVNQFHWRSAECLTDNAIEWLDEQASSPFLLYVHYVDPHNRYNAPPPFKDRFTYGYTGDDERIAMGNTSPFEMRIKRRQKINLPPSDVQHLSDLYDGEIAYVDSQIGRLASHLRQSGLLENTILVITSDHGEEFMEHGVLGHRFNLYSTLLHVPLIITGPGITAGKRVTEPASLADVMPTILELLGIEPEPYVWGKSLLGSIRGRETAPRPAFSQRGAPKYRQWALVSGNYRLIYDKANGFRRFYNMEDDPVEIYDLAGKGLPEEDRLVDELHAVLDWIKSHKLPTELTPDEKNHMIEEQRKRLKALGYVGE